MTDVKRRPYSSPSRKRQAKQTRARVLDAARRRFEADGYARTTIAEIAADAQVSVETVYKAFGSKAGVVKAVFDVAVVGDDQAVPLLARDAVRAVVAESDPRQKLDMFAAFFVESVSRSAPVELLLRTAAGSDSAAAGVYATIETERLTGTEAFARHLDRGGHLRPGLTADDARDLLWACYSAELWELLVIKRGWSTERYHAMLVDMLAGALLPGRP